MENSKYSPTWPHGKIKEIFTDIFYVTGTNITEHNHIQFQHSRNMIIVRHQGLLSLINTVRLNEEGLAALDQLGKVENIIRLGSFHGRDDAFYLDRYHSKLWAVESMQHNDERPTDCFLDPNEPPPFPNCSSFIFETSEHPEGILYLTVANGILITCDSIKNWLKADEFFSEQSANMYKEQGFFGRASISKVWRDACKVKVEDFKRLQELEFKHLLSAHGEPLLDTAHEDLARSIERAYGAQV